MSLISEALRKARQEAAARDRGGVIGPGYPPRDGSRLGTGLVLGALIALAAVLGGGGVAWWLLGSRSAEPEAARVAAAATTEGLGGGTAAAADRAPESGGDAPDRAAAAELEPAVRPGGRDEPAARDEPAPGNPDGESQARPAAPAPEVVSSVWPPPSSPSGERVFLVVAEHGDRTLTLDYLVHRATDPFAQVNGVEVHVGSTVAGCTVEAITEDAVRLRDERGLIVLRAR
jgi:hypothetical protein